MSSLSRIHVSGVRSFAPDKPQALLFYSPLTLIVGENGSGKTTLIECLRYMTTGELPVSTAGISKNANFAHDCNINDIDGCKSQIKLQFFDVSNEAIVVTRTMNSSRKTVGGQKKVECKIADAVIRRLNKRTGEFNHIPTKCADMNREMAELLGVPDAVLDNVIFCHQEDSNWPLSEPKALKMRFDDIFAATKYMKALEKMKVLQKDLGRQISEFKKELPHLLTFMEHAKKYRIQITAEENTLRQYEDEIAQKTAEMEPIRRKLDEFNRHRIEIDRLRSTLATLKSDKAATEKTINELRANIQDYYSGEIDELKQDIKVFDTDQKRIAENLSARKRDVEQLERKEFALNKQKGDLLTQKGKLEAEIQNNKERMENRDKQIVEFSTKLGFSGFTRTPFSEPTVTEFCNAIDKKIEKTNDETATEKKELDKRIREAKAEAERASNDLAANNEAITLKDKSAQRFEEELGQARTFLSEMDNRQTRLIALDKEIGSLESSLKSAEKQTNEETLKNDVAKLQNDRNNADAKIRTLTEELKVANREKNIRMELDMVQKEKVAKDENLQKFMGRHQDGIKEFFPKVDISRLRDTVDEEVTRRSKQLSSSNEKLNEAKLAQKSKERERDLRNADLKAKERELREAEEKIDKVLSGDAIDEELENLRGSLEKLQFEKGTVDGSENMLKSYKKKLENQPCCPLCERNFSEKKDAKALSDKLTREIKQLPDRAKTLHQKIEEQQQRQTELLQLQPVVELAKDLKVNVVPTLRKRVDELAAEIRTIKKDITELENITALHADEEQSVKNIQADVGQMDALFKEIQDLDRRMAVQKEKAGYNPNVRSVETIEQEIDVIQMDLDDIATSLTSKQDKLSSYREKVQRFRQNINDLTKEKLEITDAMQQRIAYQEKVSSLTKQRDQCRQEVEELRRKTQSLKRNLDELRIKERKIESEKEDFMREQQKRLQTLESYQRIVSESNAAIKKFESSGKRGQFDECVQKIANVERDLSDNIRQSTALVQQNDEQERALGQSKTKLRELEDNLKVKEKEKLIRLWSSDIDKYTADLDRLGGLNVGREHETAAAQFAQLSKQLAGIEGKKEKLMESLNQKREQMKSDGYKDADENYKTKFIELTTTEAAQTDMAKYYKALDNAVIQYHSSKMEQVNATLKELWQKIYKHNDIDYIAVKSAEAEGTDKRRAYNYRVVMKSGGTELDMRGRCSAGQKVLASILIRIALAETFSTNCGILALDEPTTNLDAANISGLAHALVELIEDRSQQKNFQLLLITHDEKFVGMLLHGFPTEYYYRVRKDENGFSVIEQSKTSDLTD